MSRSRVGRRKAVVLSVPQPRHTIPSAAQVEVKRVFSELAEKRAQLEGQWNAFIEGVRISIGAPRGAIIDKDPKSGDVFFSVPVPPANGAQPKIPTPENPEAAAGAS